MVRPKVSPPKPHIAPQNQHHISVSRGVAERTPKRSFVWIEAKSQGAINHENRPPASQKTSHDHSLIRLYGT